MRNAECCAGLVLLAFALPSSGSAQPAPVVRPQPRFEEQTSVEKRAAVETDDTVFLHNHYGNVVAAGVSGREAVIRVELAAGGDSRQDAQDFLRRMTVVADRQGRRLNISVSCPQCGAATEYRSNFNLKLPVRAVLRIENTYGDVTVDDMQGMVLVQNRFGSLGVHNCRAAEVANVVGDVNITGLTQRSLVDNRFGNVNARNLQGSIRINNENGALHLAGSSGQVQLDNKLGDISIAACRGRFRVSNNLGNVVFAQTENTPDTAIVSCRSGGIRLNLPAAPSTRISARANQGRIDAQLSGASVTASDEGQSLNCTLGQGLASFELETAGGDVSIGTAP
jgi:hypothetical protein